MRAKAELAITIILTDAEVTAVQVLTRKPPQPLAERATVADAVRNHVRAWLTPVATEVEQRRSKVAKTAYLN